MALIGDGLLTMLAPDEHVDAWRAQSGVGDDALDAILRHRELFRVFGACEVLAGLWLGGAARRN